MLVVRGAATFVQLAVKVHVKSAVPLDGAIQNAVQLTRHNQAALTREAQHHHGQSAGSISLQTPAFYNQKVIAGFRLDVFDFIRRIFAVVSLIIVYIVGLQRLVDIHIKRAVFSERALLRAVKPTVHAQVAAASHSRVGNTIFIIQVCFICRPERIPRVAARNCDLKIRRVVIVIETYRRNTIRDIAAISDGEMQMRACRITA